MFRRVIHYFSLFFLFCVVVACVSGSIRKVTVTQDLPADLPKDLKDKFEVSELKQRGEALPVKENAKGKKKSKKTALKPDLNIPFVYPVRKPEKDPIWVG